MKWILFVREHEILSEWHFYLLELDAFETDN